MKQILMVGFSGILDSGQVKNQEKNSWEKSMSRFRGKLVKMIKDAGSKFGDYSILSKIKQILLHWGYELTEKDVFINSTN